MRATMHLAAGDDIDACDLLIEDRGLRCAILGVDKVPRRHLPERREAIQRLVPAWDAVRPDHGRRVFDVAHALSPLPQMARWSGRLERNAGARRSSAPRQRSLNDGSARLHECNTRIAGNC